jgi:hypothetical protein
MTLTLFDRSPFKRSLFERSFAWSAPAPLLGQAASAPTTTTAADPWPWPLVPLCLGITIGLAALVLIFVHHYVIQANE